MNRLVPYRLVVVCFFLALASVQGQTYEDVAAQVEAALAEPGGVSWATYQRLRLEIRVLRGQSGREVGERLRRLVDDLDEALRRENREVSSERLVPAEAPEWKDHVTRWASHSASLISIGILATLGVAVLTPISLPTAMPAILKGAGLVAGLLSFGVLAKENADAVEAGRESNRWGLWAQGLGTAFLAATPAQGLAATGRSVFLLVGQLLADLSQVGIGLWGRVVSYRARAAHLSQQLRARERAKLLLSGTVELALALFLSGDALPTLGRWIRSPFQPSLAHASTGGFEVHPKRRKLVRLWNRRSLDKDGEGNIVAEKIDFYDPIDVAGARSVELRNVSFGEDLALRGSDSVSIREGILEQNLGLHEVGETALLHGVDVRGGVVASGQADRRTSFELLDESQVFGGVELQQWERARIGGRSSVAETVTSDGGRTTLDHESTIGAFEGKNQADVFLFGGVRDGVKTSDGRIQAQGASIGGDIDLVSDQPNRERNLNILIADRSEVRGSVTNWHSSGILVRASTIHGDALAPNQQLSVTQKARIEGDALSGSRAELSNAIVRGELTVHSWSQAIEGRSRIGSLVIKEPKPNDRFGNEKVPAGYDYVVFLKDRSEIEMNVTFPEGSRGLVVRGPQAQIGGLIINGDLRER